jgi:hypothetical protein
MHSKSIEGPAESFFSRPWYSLRWIQITVLVLSFFGAYAVKCYLGFNLFKSFSLSHYPPFAYLAPKGYIEKEKVGLLFEDDFNRDKIGPQWANLWVEKNENGKIGLTSHNGITGDSCLTISKEGPGSWAISTTMYFEVEAGDVFYIGGSAKGVSGGMVYFGVSARDDTEGELFQFFVNEEIPQTGKWIAFEKRFTVQSPVRFIQFRFSGSGMVSCCFDNIQVVRESIPIVKRFK